MKNRDSLFQLIKSLTKNEKGYFKKHVSGMAGKNASAYLSLFDAFAKQKIYDDGKIKKELDNTILRKQNLAVTKHYLYEAILKSLRAYYGKPSMDSMLKEMIRNAEILFYLKDRKEDSKEILYKALRIASRYERFLVQLEIYNFLYTVDFSLQDNHADPLRITGEAFQRQLFLLEQHRNYVELRTLFAQLKIVLGNSAHRQDKEHTELKAILNNPLLKDKITPSYKANLYYYTIRANIVGYGFHDPKKSCELNKKLVAFMESDPAKLGEDLSHYSLALNSLMADQMRTGQYDEMKQTYEKIRNKFSSYGFEFIKFNAFGAAASTELAYYAATYQLREGLALIENIEREIIPQENKINRNYRIELILGIAVIYLLSRNFAKARFWLNKNLLDNSPECKDIKAFSLILNLIATYELKDYDYLEHLVSVCKRNIKINGVYYKFESPILDFMNKAMMAPAEKKMDNYLQELKAALGSERNHNGEKTMYNYFNIPLWIQSKIEKVKMTELFPKKNR